MTGQGWLDPYSGTGSFITGWMDFLSISLFLSLSPSLSLSLTHTRTHTEWKGTTESRVVYINSNSRDTSINIPLQPWGNCPDILVSTNH
jgi:hypothetical protein